MFYLLKFSTRICNTLIVNYFKLTFQISNSSTSFRLDVVFKPSMVKVEHYIRLILSLGNFRCTSLPPYSYQFCYQFSYFGGGRNGGSCDISFLFIYKNVIHTDTELNGRLASLNIPAQRIITLTCNQIKKIIFVYRRLFSP